MTKETFDAEFVAAYHQLQRYGRFMADDGGMDLVHELYCRLHRECGLYERITPSFMRTRLKWLSYERYRQFPSYMELTPQFAAQEPPEPTHLAVVTEEAMASWSEKDRDIAEMIAYPQTRASWFKLVPAHRRIRPLLELAFRRAGVKV